MNKLVISPVFHPFEFKTSKHILPGFVRSPLALGRKPKKMGVGTQKVKVFVVEF